MFARSSSMEAPSGSAALGEWEKAFAISQLDPEFYGKKIRPGVTPVEEMVASVPKHVRDTKASQTGRAGVKIVLCLSLWKHSVCS